MIHLPPTVLLANGAFPSTPEPLQVLEQARRVICCDGAADALVALGREPSWIVGDLDSVSDVVRERFVDRVVSVSEQETNDLAKGFRFCRERRWRELALLGVTGGREDHTLGNLSLLVDFAEEALVTAFTDEGVFTPVLGSMQFRSYPGQQVSIFSFQPGVRVYAEGLRYPLDDVPFTRWWQASLNESEGAMFQLVFEGGPLLVFQAYERET